MPSRWLNNGKMLLYKSGDPIEGRNYRPISIAPAMYVVLTKLICESIAPDLNRSHAQGNTAPREKGPRSRP